MPISDIGSRYTVYTLLTEVKWERINHRYEKCAAEICDTSDKELINILEELKEQKEVIELDLQHSSIMLNSSDGISVKIPPDFSN